MGDTLLALLLLPPILLESTAHDFGDARGVLLAVLFVLPLFLRRTRPVTAASMALLPHALQVLWVDTGLAGNCVVPLHVYAVAAYAPQRWVRPWLGIGWVGAAGAALDWSTVDGTRLDSLAAFVFGGCGAVVTASWVMGRLQRERELTSQRERVLAGEQERARIARDMHDVVAHSLSVIVVQADGGRYVATHDGDADARLAKAAEVLATIGDTARTALTETRRIVGVLHTDGGGSRQPQAALHQVPELVRSVGDAGFPAVLEVEGNPDAYASLGPGVEMAAYRVVQEALTNVMKHAGPGASAVVRLVHRPHELFVEVVDDGHGHGHDDGLGHGVIGMQERVAAFGGHLEAGPRGGGGYAVRATIPRRTEGTP